MGQKLRIICCKKKKTAEFMPPAERETKIKALLDELKSIPPPQAFVHKSNRIVCKVATSPVQHESLPQAGPIYSRCTHKIDQSEGKRQDSRRERAKKIANKKKEAEKSSDKEPSPTPQSLVLEENSPTVNL